MSTNSSPAPILAYLPTTTVSALQDPQVGPSFKMERESVVERISSGLSASWRKIALVLGLGACVLAAVYALYSKRGTDAPAAAQTEGAGSIASEAVTASGLVTQKVVQESIPESVGTSSDIPPVQAISTPQPVDVAQLGAAVHASTVVAASVVQPSAGVVVPAALPAASVGAGNSNAMTSAATVSPPAAVSASQASNQARVQLQAKKESWVRVTDANKKILISKTLQAGENVQLDGVPPFRVIVGRAEDMSIFYMGKPVTYPAQMQVGTARFDLPLP